MVRAQVLVAASLAIVGAGLLWTAVAASRLAATAAELMPSLIDAVSNISRRADAIAQRLSELQPPPLPTPLMLTE